MILMSGSTDIPPSNIGRNFFFDPDAFLSDLGSVPGSIIELFDDVDDDLHASEVLFMDVVNVHVPSSERTPSQTATAA